MTVQIKLRQETAVKLEFIASSLKMSVDEYLSKIADLVSPPAEAVRSAPEDAGLQGRGMMAVLGRSAKRLAGMPVSGETKDTVDAIRKGRNGEMWGDEPGT